MVDTIAIILHEKQFTIMNHDRFSPSTYNLYNPPYIRVNGRSSFKAVNNPTLEDKQKYGYLPRLTLFKVIRAGGFATFLKIEFSAPKMLFDNNFDEVDRSDFKSLYQALHRKLFAMGVSVPNINDLIHAEVSAIHYCKNIILTDYSTPSSIINELSKVNISRTKDTNISNYRNEGHVFKYHSNNFEVVFYDKLADLNQAKKSDRRAIEKDNYVQLSLFDLVKPKKPFEVIRMEIRLGDKKKIKQLLEANGIQTSKITLYALFSKQIAKKLLQSTLNELEANYPTYVLNEATLEDILANTQLSKPKAGFKHVLSLVAAQFAIKEMGIRKFRNNIRKYGDTTWYRLNKDLKSLQPMKKIKQFAALSDDLDKFEKVRLADYKEWM